MKVNDIRGFISRFNLINGLLLVLLIIGLLCLSQGLWIKAKAELAQVLISSAWQANSQGLSAKPWPWADMKPVAELSFSDQKESLIALEGIEGNSLAFGPGLITVNRSELGLTKKESGKGSEVVIIAGHNDTHFHFLPELKHDSRISLQRPLQHSLQNSERVDEYQVISIRVVDSSKEPMRFIEGEDLLLVTCYPFDSLERNGPLRYVVAARRLNDSEQPSTRSVVEQTVASSPIYF